MAHKIVVEKNELRDEKNRFKYAADLETGNLLFFPEIPFDLTNEERSALANKKADDLIMWSFSKKVEELLQRVLSPYTEEWICQEPIFLEETAETISFNSQENAPVHGGRLLRFFMNISQTETFRLITSESFGSLAVKLGGKEVPFPKSPSYSWIHRLLRKTRKMMNRLGMKMPLRSPYDSFMLQLKSHLKKNASFQKECIKEYWEFPPNSCWALFADQIPYASGSCATVLEKTFIVPQRALLFPEKSPLAILERLTNGNMVNTDYLQ